MNSIASVIKAKRRLFKYNVEHVAERLLEFGLSVSPKTIYNWENDHSQPTPEIFLALCKIYEIYDVLGDFGLADAGHNSVDLIPLPEARHLMEYRKLNSVGKEKATGICIDLQAAYPAESADFIIPDNIIIENILSENGRELPLYTMSASAGAGVWAGEGDYELITADDSIPISASFGVKIRGDSMEPTIPDGSIAWVKKQPDVNTGEVCIVVINGEGFCKVKGRNSFHSINPAYSQIRVHEYDDVKISGKVIYVQKP